MSTNCPQCNALIAQEKAKFCPECGAQITTAADGGAVIAPQQQPVIPLVTPAIPVEPDDQGFAEICKDVAAVTVELLQAEGWTVQKGVRDQLKTGALADFELIARKEFNGRPVTRIVECKAGAVDKDKVEAFAKKVAAYEKLKDANPLFVAIAFTPDARKQADASDVLLWDVYDLLERSLAAKGTPARDLKLTDAVPMLVDYAVATKLDLENPGHIQVNSARLAWRPFYKISYTLHVTQNDPNGQARQVDDSGECIIDARSGAVLNMQVSAQEVKDKVMSLVRHDAAAPYSKDMMFADELKPSCQHDYPSPAGKDYVTVLIKPTVSGEAARDTALDAIVLKNMKTFSYEVPGEKGAGAILAKVKPQHFTITPKKADIDVKDAALVYVPKWDVEFVSGVMIYRRELIGPRGTALTDSMRYCPSHKLMGRVEVQKKETVAACDADGRAFCKDHIFKCPVCSKWLCEEHSMKCGTCGQHFCPEHIGKCADCGAPTCEKCKKVCPICGEVHCKKNWVKCDKCGKEICTSCVGATSGMVIKKYTCKVCVSQNLPVTQPGDKK